MSDPFLYLCGAAGALIYAVPVLMAGLTSIPPAKLPWMMFGFSILTGAIIAPVLTPLLGHKWPFLLQPEPYPLAVGIGLLANPIVPIFVRRVTQMAENYAPTFGGKKP